ncbi:hypothetical protein RY831_10250 [Noviherbaspirillum sp. CPCC 100848]|uniref:Uncharacterized protein n=1 Tax=Noviherbaspirillum album TaxID=3080276 RepID=A0ABU6J8C2_9BURK|nr:hypothetical protein [Noviherbaspirillum sp. CPCC 100848]MEC4719532.1 hypothetical protein [Noviherbaspirillum sp. CPCC 100848]
MSKHVTFQTPGTSLSGIRPEVPPDNPTTPSQVPPARPQTEAPHHHHSANVESSRANFLKRILNDAKRTSGTVVSSLETTAQKRMSIAQHNVQSMKGKYFPEKPFSKAHVPSESNVRSAQVREGEVETTAPSPDTKHFSFNPVRGIVSRKPKLTAETPEQSGHIDRRGNRRRNFFAAFLPSIRKQGQPTTISIAVQSTSHVAVSTSFRRIGLEHLVTMLEANLNGIRAGLTTFENIPYGMKDFEEKRGLLSENVSQLRRMATGLSGMARIADQIKLINIDTAGLSLENIERIAARANDIYYRPIQQDPENQLSPIRFYDLGSPAIYGDSGQEQGSTSTQPNLALSPKVWLKIIKAVSQTNLLLRSLEKEIAALKGNLQPSVTSGSENAAEASTAPHARSKKGKGKAEAPIAAGSRPAAEVPVPAAGETARELTLMESVLAAGEKAKRDFSVPLPETTAGLFQYK